MATPRPGTLTRRYQSWPDHFSPELAISEPALARFFGVCGRQLQRWRKAGNGPRHLPTDKTRENCVWYRAADAIAWRAAILGSQEDADAIVRAWRNSTPIWLQKLQPPSIGGRRAFRNVAVWQKKSERTRISLRRQKLRLEKQRLLLLIREAEIRQAGF